MATPLNIEHAWEMLDYGISSPSATARTFYRSQIMLDPADFDGATFSFEVVAYNSSGGELDVTLTDTFDNSTAVGVTVGASTTITRYRSSAFIPASGSHTYLISLPSTTENALRVYTARLIITQVAATKTKLQFPLTASTYSNYSGANDNSIAVDSLATASYGHTSNGYYSKWLHDASRLGSLSSGEPWEFEAIACMSAAADGYVALTHNGDVSKVVEELAVTGVTPTRYASTFADTATNFDDVQQLEVNIKGDGTNSLVLQRSALYVKLSPITKAECYLRVAGTLGATNVATNYVTQRIQSNEDSYSGTAVAFYTEAIGSCADNADCFIPQSVASPSGTGGADITGAGINFNSATRALLRTSAWTPPTDSDDIYWRRLASTANSAAVCAFIVVAVTAGSLFDSSIFDSDVFHVEADGAPDPSPTADHDLFDGTLKIMVGTLDVTASVLPGLSFSTTNPGGFGECSFSLPGGSPIWTFGPFNAAVVKGAAVTITHGATPTTLFEGEITNDVGHAVIEDGFAYYNVTAAGLWWKAGQRDDFCHIWGDDDTGQWFEKNTTGGVFQVDTDGKVEIRLEAGQEAKNGASKSLYYWLDNGMGDSASTIESFVGLAAGYVADKNSAAWHADILSSDSPWGSWTVEKSWDNETVAAGTPISFSPAAGTKALQLKLYVDGATSTGTTSDRYIRLSSFAVSTSIQRASNITGITRASPAVITTQLDHNLKAGDRVFVINTNSVATFDGWRTVATTPTSSTLTLTGVNVATTAGTDGDIYSAERVDEAMAAIAGYDAAITTDLAASASLQTGGIGNVNWGINVRPHMSRAEAIEMLAANNADPIDYGFWDSGVFYCKARAVSPPAANDYVVDTTDPGIDFDVYKDTEESPTHVKILYLTRNDAVYPDGTLRAVYRPSAPTWADASVVLDVWDQWADMTLEEAQAEDIGDQILDWLDSNQYVGTITIAATTVPLRAGGTKNTAYIRAGDYVQDADGAMNRAMITSTNMDVDAGVMTLGIGETKHDFVARITPPRASGDRRFPGNSGWQPPSPRHR